MLCYYSLCLFLKTSFKIFHIYGKQIGNKFPDRVSLEETDIEYRRIVVFIDTESIILLVCFFFFFLWTYHELSEKALATHSSVLAWKIPWSEEPGRLPWVAQSWTWLKRLSSSSSHEPWIKPNTVGTIVSTTTSFTHWQNLHSPRDIQET